MNINIFISDVFYTVYDVYYVPHKLSYRFFVQCKNNIYGIFIFLFTPNFQAVIYETVTLAIFLKCRNIVEFLHLVVYRCTSSDTISLYLFKKIR